MYKTPISIIAAFSIMTATALGSDGDPSVNEALTTADAVCRGLLLDNQPFEKGLNNCIFTATGFSVAEAFKGVFGSTVRVEHRGGELNGRGEEYCGRPVFQADEDYLLFIRRREDGSLYCSHYLRATDVAYASVLEQLRQQAGALEGAGMDLSDQQSSLFAAMNLLPGSTGFSSRFLQGDRGEPIEYIVDMDDWPSGITSNQALNAVSNAFAAWSATTTLTFKFGGVESFGMAAPDVGGNDGRIYVQLHDNHGYIDSSTTLGRGGHSYSYSSSWPDGGLGGRVGTNEFNRTEKGFLVMEHSKSSLSTLLNFEEVLCHEIGHILSLGHSSEDGGESDPELEDATMYYLAHFDGRGAALRQWDTNTIHIVHPFDNTPPYGYDRVIRAVTSPGPQAPLSSGVNQVEFQSYDLQGGAVSVLVTSTSNYGEFTLENSNTIFYTPSGRYGDSSEAEGSFYYDLCYVRMSDGVNLSPPIPVRVIQLLSDGNSDQLPDSWVAVHGVSGGASGDHDNDTFTNLEEWFLDTDPDDQDSFLKMGISSTGPYWNTRPRELYQVQSTTNLVDGFSNDGNPILAGFTNEVMTIEYGVREFYRVQRLK